MLTPHSLRAPACRPCRSRGLQRAGLCTAGSRVNRRRLEVRAEATGDRQPEQLGLAPAKPKTAYGEMLAYYLKMEPQLFKTAVEDQLQRLKQEKDSKQLSDSSVDMEQGKDKMELALYKRMEEVRANEVRATLEDLMYVSILEKFVVLGVEMLPRMDGFVDVAPTNLRALTEGIHSKEALELVREHLLSVMGQATLEQFSNAAIKMSKFQMAQVYAASIMFGYFLRRVDRRFQLEKSMGTLPTSREDAVARLERLFNAAESTDHPVESEMSTSASGRQQEGASSSGQQSGKENLPAVKQKSALRRYVESFDQAAMVETARIVSTEGAALVERQTGALLGDIKKLTAEIQEAVGKDASSMEEVMTRMAKAVEFDKVETVTMTVGTQRRAVFEAVAFGTFLRDVETWVHEDYGLLTPMPAIKLPPGRPSSDDRETDDDDDSPLTL